MLCTALLFCQVLIFNLLPPPGSPPLQPDERGAAWSAPPLAVEVQAQLVDAMERVSGLCRQTIIQLLRICHIAMVWAPLAVQVQAQLVDAMERVSGNIMCTQSSSSGSKSIVELT